MNGSLVILVCIGECVAWLARWPVLDIGAYKDAADFYKAKAISFLTFPEGEFDGCDVGTSGRSPFVDEDPVSGPGAACVGAKAS